MLGETAAVGGAVEGLAAPFGGGGVAGADGVEEVALGGPVGDGVGAVVGAIEGAVRGGQDGVGAAAEGALAEAAEESALGVEDEERVLGVAGEEVDVVFGVDGDAGDIDEGEAGGQLLPGGEGLVAEGALAEFNGIGIDGHGLS